MINTEWLIDIYKNVLKYRHKIKLYKDKIIFIRVKDNFCWEFDFYGNLGKHYYR